MPTIQPGKVSQKAPVVSSLPRTARRVAEPEPVGRRPEEHVDEGEVGHEAQQPRAQRPRAEADLLEQPAREVLERDQMAGPAAEPAPEEGGEEDRAGEEDEAGVDDAGLGEGHRLGGLDRRHRAPGDEPVGDVKRDRDVDRDEHRRPPLGRARVPDRGASGLDGRTGRSGPRFNLLGPQPARSRR